VTDSSHDTKPSQPDAEEFADYAQQPHVGIVREFVDFLCHNKKWWLAPIVVILLLFGLLIIVAGTPGGAFIYTLF
jgi:hypothetical protein